MLVVRPHPVKPRRRFAKDLNGFLALGSLPGRMGHLHGRGQGWGRLCIGGMLAACAAGAEPSSPPDDGGVEAGPLDGGPCDPACAAGEVCQLGRCRPACGSDGTCPAGPRLLRRCLRAHRRGRRALRGLWTTLCTVGKRLLRERLFLRERTRLFGRGDLLSRGVRGSHFERDRLRRLRTQLRGGTRVCGRVVSSGGMRSAVPRRRALPRRGVPVRSSAPLRGGAKLLRRRMHPIDRRRCELRRLRRKLCRCPRVPRWHLHRRHRLLPPCARGEVCSGRACFCGAGPSCLDGDACCDGACVDTRAEASHCGRCGNACPSGWECCDGTCIDVQSDRGHCGGCGAACGQAADRCTAGQCFCGGDFACSPPLLCLLEECTLR